MKPRHAATIALQSPVNPAYRDPKELTMFMVCPHCLGVLTAHSFIAQDDSIVSTYHCKQHGDVCPRLSNIAN